MATPVRSLRVVGVHPVLPTSQQFREAVHVQSGSDLASEELSRAEDRVRAHFGGLYLLEIEVCPAASDIDWGPLLSRYATSRAKLGRSPTMSSASVRTEIAGRSSSTILT
jgi:hypothetical protein